MLSYAILWSQYLWNRLSGHTGPVHHVCYSPSGSLLASSSSDKTVRLWLPNAGGNSVVLKGHTGGVRCVDFCSKRNGSLSYEHFQETSSLLITASDDKTAKIWSLPSKKFVCSFTGHTHYVRTAKFSPDTHIVSSNDCSFRQSQWAAV